MTSFRVRIRLHSELEYDFNCGIPNLAKDSRPSISSSVPLCVCTPSRIG